MYNILINNLSTDRSNVTEESRYRLNTGEDTGLPDEDRLFRGVYTNEPITHALIRKFAAENQGEKLDLIWIQFLQILFGIPKVKRGISTAGEDKIKYTACFILR